MRPSPATRAHARRRAARALVAVDTAPALQGLTGIGLLVLVVLVVRLITG